MDREIYFIKCNNAVKVGISRDVEHRFCALQSANPTELKLIHTMLGDEIQEHAIHCALSDYWIRGEWYKFLGVALYFRNHNIKLDPDIKIKYLSRYAEDKKKIITE